MIPKWRPSLQLTTLGRRPIDRIGPVLLLVALVLILNPELRALMLFANMLGLEVIGILLLIQLRVMFEVARARMRPAELVCNLAARFGYLAFAAFPRTVGYRRFNALFGPLLITASYGLICRGGKHLPGNLS